MNDKLDVIDEEQAKFFFFSSSELHLLLKFVNIYFMIYVGATKCHWKSTRIYN
jgi:hypothetical protein